MNTPQKAQYLGVFKDRQGRRHYRKFTTETAAKKYARTGKVS